MKQITIVFLLLLFPLNIFATTEIYYSDYNSFSEYTTEKKQLTDLVDVEEQTFYKWYREQYYFDYYIKETNESEHQKLDETDFIQTTFSNWSLNVPDEKPNREVQTRSVYYYSDIKKIKYIHFYSLSGSNNRLNLNEITIYNKNNNRINYNIICEGCNDNFHKYINDGNNYQVDSYIEVGGYLRLELDDYYDLNDLKIQLYLTDFDRDEKNFEINTSRDAVINNNIYSWIFTKNWFTHNSNNEYTKCEYNIIDFLLKNPEWTDESRSLTPVLPSKTRFVLPKTEYSYRDTLYKYYSFSKVYSDDYYISPPEEFPIKDTTDFKQFYRYRSRDKFVIKKDIVITEKNTKLEDYVIFNSNPDLKITSNININKNGTYKAYYKLPYITVAKDVIVNIDKIDEQKLNTKTSVILSKEILNDEIEKHLPVISEKNTERGKSDELVKNQIINVPKPNKKLILFSTLFLLALLILLIIRMIKNKMSD